MPSPTHALAAPATASRAKTAPVPRPAAPSPEVRHILHAPRAQPKVTVGAADDAFEQEADRVAGEVMRMPEGQVARMCTECDDEKEVRRARDINVLPPEKNPPEDVEELRRKALPGEEDGSLDDAASNAVASRDAGRPLSESTRQFFEPRFERDFGAVRIHDGGSAQHSARSINARAFTFGSDIWLGAGERESDRPLLAHELAHVVQQRHAPAALRAYRHTNTVYLRDVYRDAGEDPAAVTDDQLRTTIEYEDYTRADLTWRFSDTVAIGALRRSMSLFQAGVRGRGPNYIRSGREARAAAHGIGSITLSALGFTGDLLITSVTGGLGGATGATIDDPDGSSPVWTAAGTRELVAYVLGTAPTMFARFTVAPAPAAPVPNVQVRALTGSTVLGQATGLQISGSAIESVAGGGVVTGIGGGAAFPGADVGDLTADIRFETSTDGGQVWFASGSAQVRVIFTAAAPTPPGGVLRQDVLDRGGAVISSAASAAADLRGLVQANVTYDPRTGMGLGYTTSDAVMRAFTTPDQCNSMAYLLRYLARSFGIAADVVYVWMGTSGEAWYYLTHNNLRVGFQCNRPAEDMAQNEPHFRFHALTNINGTLHDPSYNIAGLPFIKEWSPGATLQQGTGADYSAAAEVNKNVQCGHDAGVNP